MRRTLELKYKLALSDTRAEGVRDIVAAFQKAGTLVGAAALLDVHRRTLHRWTLEYDDLKKALEAAKTAAKAEEPADNF